MRSDCKSERTEMVFWKKCGNISKFVYFCGINVKRHVIKRHTESNPTTWQGDYPR